MMNFARRLRLRGALLLPLLTGAAQVYGATTISGTVDAYLEKTSVPGHSALRLESSGLGVSRIVIRTSEILGGDWRASAYLEGGVGVDNGGGNQNGVFNRLSYVRLSNSTASLTVGKQYSPHVLQLAAEYDTFATSFWATPYAFFQGAARYMLVPKAVTLEVRALPAQRLKLSLMWARRPDRTALAPAGDQLFASAFYRVDERLGIGVSQVHDHRFSHLSPKAKLTLIGFNFDAGTIRVSGGAQTIALQAGLNRINEFCIGMGVKVSGADLVQVNYAKSYEPGQAARHSSVMGIALVHTLSKRTALYTAWGQMQNGAAYDNYFDLATLPGESAKNLMLGVRHSF